VEPMLASSNPLYTLPKQQQKRRNLLKRPALQLLLEVTELVARG
jgi:hypothetical protein